MKTTKIERDKSLQKVFVTGITGKSGLFFFDEIKQQKNEKMEFTCLVRDESKAKWLMDAMPEIKVCIGSLDDKALIHKIFTDADFDTVLHIAGISRSLDLVKEAIDASVKWLVLVHTTGIFSKYKAAGENYRQIENKIELMRKGKDVSLTILRPTMIYGNLHDGNIAVFIKMVYKMRIFPVVNNARYELQPVWCGDLGKAYYQVLVNSDKTKDKNYNLSGGSPIMLIDMLKVMANKLGVKNRFVNVPFWIAYSGAWLLYLFSIGRIDFREKVQRLVEPRIFDHFEAQRDFGYQPVDFEQGVDSEIRDFQKSHQ